MILLKNCRLIPELTEGYDGINADILIQNKKIKAILQVGTCREKCRTYDMEGRTVMPGLFDLHMHFCFGTMNMAEMSHKNVAQNLIAGIEYGKDYLRNGYTTVRDCGSYDNTAVTIRDAIKSGILEGPRVIASCRCNTPPAQGNDAFGSLYCEFNGPQEALKVARNDIAAGADFVKYMVTGAMMNEGGTPGAMICTKDELNALSEAAQRLGSYVAAHCHGKEGIMACIEAEIGTIEHATYIDEECIDAILKHGNVTAIIPTLGIVYSMAKDLAGNTPTFMKARTQEVIDMALKNIKRAYDRGVRMGWGSDCDRPTFNMFPGLEFRARKDMGLTNVQLLKQATIDSAKIVHLDDVTGTVKVGKYADLIAVNGEPDKDISVMYQLPAYVFAEGTVIENSIEDMVCDNDIKNGKAKGGRR